MGTKARTPYTIRTCDNQIARATPEQIAAAAGRTESDLRDLSAELERQRSDRGGRVHAGLTHADWTMAREVWLQLSKPVNTDHR